MKKILLLFLAVVVATFFVACPLQTASLVVYNNLYYNSIAVSVDSVVKEVVGPGSSGTITGISVGTHTLFAITDGPYDYIHSTSKSANFSANETKTWIIFNVGGSSLSLVPFDNKNNVTKEESLLNK